MNQKVAKKLRKMCQFKVYRPRKYFEKQNRLNMRVRCGIIVDPNRAVYLLAKNVYKQSGDMDQVSRVVEQFRNKFIESAR